MFGLRIKDVPLRRNKPRSLFPALAQTKYFKFPKDESAGSVTAELHEAMALDSTSWLAATREIRPCAGDR